MSDVRNATNPSAAARELVPVMKALSDENRLAILLTLVSGPHNVVEMCESLGLGQTLVSHHLKALRETGLVSATPVGRSNVYELCCGAVAEPVRNLAAQAGLSVTPVLA